MRDSHSIIPNHSEIEEVGVGFSSKQSTLPSKRSVNLLVLVQEVQETGLGVVERAVHIDSVEVLGEVDQSLWKDLLNIDHVEIEEGAFGVSLVDSHLLPSLVASVEGVEYLGDHAESYVGSCCSLLWYEVGAVGLLPDDIAIVAN